MTEFRRILVVMVVVVASSARLTHALLGIPSFLEFGSCAEISLKKNFDPVKYSGLWFDIESVPNEYQHTKKCVTQNYTWTGEQMDVATQGLTIDDEKVRQLAVMLRDESIDNPASMLVQAAGVPEAPYQVIATDYRTFSCVYSCLDGYAGFMAEFMWVFSRTPTLPTDKIKYCYDTFTSMGIHPEKMVPVVQGHPCPYFKKLDQTLLESEKHLMEVVGPAQSSTPPPIPATHPSSSAQPRMRDNEVQELLDVVHEERDFLEDLKHNLEFGNKNHDLLGGGKASRTQDSQSEAKAVAAVPAQGSSVREVEAADPNTTSASVPAIPLLLLLLLLTLLQF